MSTGASGAGYTASTHYRRTDVSGSGGTGWVINLFPMGVGFNAFVGEDEYIGHYETHDAGIAAVIGKLESNERSTR